MDIISRLLGCAGQAPDAVSASTQVKMEDAPTLLKIPQSQNVQIFRYVSETQMAKIMVQYGRPVVPLERNLYCHPLARLLWETPFEKVLLGHG